MSRSDLRPILLEAHLLHAWRSPAVGGASAHRRPGPSVCGTNLGATWRWHARGRGGEPWVHWSPGAAAFIKVGVAAAEGVKGGF